MTRVDMDDHAYGYARRRGAPGEVELWQAVLRLAVLDAQVLGCRAATRWLRSSRQGIGSFVYVCDVLGAEAGVVRRQIFTLLAAGAKFKYCKKVVKHRACGTMVYRNRRRRYV